MSLDRETLVEFQWIIEGVIRGLHERAHYFGQYKKYSDWAEFMVADANLLDQSWRRLNQQIQHD
jgi:hypothetical protein